MNKKNIIIAIVALLAAVAIGVGAFFLFKEKDSKDSGSDINIDNLDDTDIFYGKDNEVEDIWEFEGWN